MSQLDFLAHVYAAEPAAAKKPRRNSISRLSPPDKDTEQLKEDILVANIMASLDPEPGELQKKLNSPRAVNHLKRRVRQRFESGPPPATPEQSRNHQGASQNE